MYINYDLIRISTLIEIIQQYVDLSMIMEICGLCDFATSHVCVIM
jgi:hypothetical protein